MKTLDEVIAEMEGMEFIGTLADALNYLKEYRDRKETMRSFTEKAISEQQNLSDTITFMQAYRDDKDDLTSLRAYWKEQHENDPLTWDELKEMVGKPLWVEGTILLSHWLIIDTIDEYMMVCSDRHRVGVPLFADVLGKCWQAYRKERK